MKVYHLHLPRTSGVFLRTVLNLNNSIVGHRSQIDINKFKNVEYAIGHYGIYPAQFADLTFSILRNPVDRTISYLKYVKYHFYPLININDLIYMYLNNDFLRESIYNIGNKFLTGTVDFNMYNRHIVDQKHMVENGWFCNGYKKNYKEAVDDIKKNNINILYYEDPLLYKKISQIYNMKIDGLPLNASKNYEVSKNLINDIIKVNEIDLEIYEHFKK